MSAPTTILIGASVTMEERPVLIAAASQLSECLADPGEPGWPVKLRFDVDPAAPPPILIASLLEETAVPDAADTIFTRQGARLSGLRDAGCENLFLCTLLRFVADRQERQSMMPRIRGLNLMAAELSHDHDVAVIDIDRVLGLFGARALKTDYRLGGPAAPEVAGHVIVAALLANGLDMFIPYDRQERAIQRHGGIHQIAGTVDRRMRMRAATKRI